MWKMRKKKKTMRMMRKRMKKKRMSMKMMLKMRNQRKSLKQKDYDAFPYGGHGEGVKNGSYHIPCDGAGVDDDCCCPLLRECC